MINAQGWLSWAERLEPSGLPNTNAGTNQVLGVFMHSAEGYASVLLDPGSQYGYNGALSWHATNLMDGRFVQHYPFTARCWHATAANDDYAGIENEGTFSREPSLNEAQIANAVRLIADLAAWKRWPSCRRPLSATDISHQLWEHNEVTRLGGSATACPSGRIPWDEILRRLDETPADDEEDTMFDWVWATWDEWQDIPGGPPFRSYLLCSTTTGLLKRHVASAEEHNAIVSAYGLIEPQKLPFETLVAFKGKPEPNDV